MTLRSDPSARRTRRRLAVAAALMALASGCAEEGTDEGGARGAGLESVVGSERSLACTPEFAGLGSDVYLHRATVGGAIAAILEERHPSWPPLADGVAESAEPGAVLTSTDPLVRYQQLDDRLWVLLDRQVVAVETLRELDQDDFRQIPAGSWGFSGGNQSTECPQWTDYLEGRGDD